MNVRDAGPGDAAAVLDVVRRAFARYVARIGQEPWPMTVPPGLLHQVTPGGRDMTADSAPGCGWSGGAPFLIPPR
jgi:hypothetical protein